MRTFCLISMTLIMYSSIRTCTCTICTTTYVLIFEDSTIVLAYVIVSKVRTSTFYLVVLRSSVYVCTLHSSVGTWNVLARHFVILVLVACSGSCPHRSHKELLTSTNMYSVLSS
jgi:hypothetical protein